MGGDFGFDPGVLIAFLLVVFRLGGMFAFVPIPGSKMVVEPAKLILILSLTVALQPAWPRVDAGALTAGRLAAWVAGECLFGTGVGVLVGMLSECLVFGAQAVTMQAGFSYASTFDPGSQADSTVLQTTAQLAANLLFFACGVDRIVLRAFARSLEACPPGSVEIGWQSASRLTHFGGEMLELGVRLALPVAGLLLLTDVTLALAGRLQSQLQLLSLAFPVKMLGSLAMLAILAPMMAWAYRAGILRMTEALSTFLR
jgi:flagellar biosynthesis protein FliR